MIEQHFTERPLKVLVLEDDPYLVELISRQLTRIPRRVELEVVTMRFDFVRALLDSIPDFILCSDTLAQFDGLEALVLVRKTFPKVPFLVLTGDQQAIQGTKWLEQGISACLPKSELDQLLPAMKEARRRNKLFHRSLVRGRVLRLLNQEVRSLIEMADHAEKLQPMFSPGEGEKTLTTLFETKMALEELYSSIQKSAPIP